MNQILPLAVLLIVLALAALWPVIWIARRRQTAIDHKVALISGQRRDKKSAEQALQAQAGKWLNKLKAQPRALFSVGLKHDWGMHSTGARLFLAGLTAGGVAWLLVGETLHLSAGLAFLAALAGFFMVPRFLLNREQTRAEAKFTDLFPDAIDMLVRMVRAGLPVAAAVRTVGRETPAPVNEVFTAVADQIEIGIPLESALAGWSERIGLADFRFFAAAVALQRATGGNLAVTLDSLAEIIRKRRAVRLKAHAATSDVRISAYILGAIPFLIAGAIALITPEYMLPLIYDPRGNVVAGIAITCLVLAALSMRWIIQRGLAA